MSEEFLHFLWQYKLYKPGKFYTCDGQLLEMVHPGLPNGSSEESGDAGPDFFNAKIKFDGTLWAGNVEIHHRASDWFLHGHHQDPLYDNVILHVVGKHDEDTISSKGTYLPVWEMQVDNALLDRYQRLFAQNGRIPCEKDIHTVSSIEISSWTERMLAEKLERKTADIEKLLEGRQNDWNEVFYIVLARNFGFGLNGEPFELLARQTPWTLVGRNADSQVKLEALFLGQAGFLDKLMYEDEHSALLAREYKILKQKYSLETLPEYLWKFLRLRPVNFPTIRLVQLAALFSHRATLLDKLLEQETLSAVRDQLQARPLPYWETHYRPGVQGNKRSKKLGRQAVDLIIINTLVPFFFAYGRLRGKPRVEQKALEWLSELPPEKNRVIKNWELVLPDFDISSAAESQALVHLKRHYCDHHKCLRCRIGHRIIALK